MSAMRYDAASRLARRAGQLTGPPPGLPALFAFTDPDRTPDPVALARALPPGAGLVLRLFGQASLREKAHEIAAIAEARRLTFLIAAEPELALQCGADGVHWPQARLKQAARHRRRFAVMSASAHDPMAARRAAQIADLVFVSPAFASRSPSAGAALGAFRLAAYARRTPAPVYALAGINADTIGRLARLKLAGVAAIDALMDGQ